MKEQDLKIELAMLGLERLKKKFEGKQVFCKKNIVNSDFKDIVKLYEVVRILKFDIDYVYREYYGDYTFCGEIEFCGIEYVFEIDMRNTSFSEFEKWINNIFVDVVEMYRVFLDSSIRDLTIKLK
jgi:hypothetical protein